MKDLKGQKFGKLTVAEFVEIKNHSAYWKCICECGNEKVVRGTNLTSGLIRSCGCLKGESHIKHQESFSRLYRIWAGMKQRCENINRRDYPKYGGSGVTVCEEWHDYMTFRKWAISHGYDDTKSIDRIDNNGGYSPRNCRWVGFQAQQNNKLNSSLLTIDGVTKTATEWSKVSGIPAERIRKRKRNGWDDKEAVFEPLNPSRQHSKKGT